MSSLAVRASVIHEQPGLPELNRHTWSVESSLGFFLGPFEYLVAVLVILQDLPVSNSDGIRWPYVRGAVSWRAFWSQSPTENACEQQDRKTAAAAPIDLLVFRSLRPQDGQASSLSLTS